MTLFDTHIVTDSDAAVYTASGSVALTYCVLQGPAVFLTVVNGGTVINHALAMPGQAAIGSLSLSSGDELKAVAPSGMVAQLGIVAL